MKKKECKYCDRMGACEGRKCYCDCHDDLEITKPLTKVQRKKLRDLGIGS